ncbi:hypothetical protein [Natrinema amylolyticum]|uniref:hypothetical protein n=1 Tax=Natrinema amylolyticum TaxID=2878679 RepID=UPI001CFB7426|nr:hypothetical protein [Natrinema amylolyticum]
MSDREAGDRDGGGSRIATNRAAVAIAIGSLLIAVVIGVLARRGLLGSVGVRGIAVDALPFYLLFLLLAVWLVVWSWRRLVSLLQ